MNLTPEQYQMTWQGILIDIRYQPHWLRAYAVAHLELQTLKPERATLPMTETGYRSHFTDREDIEQAGGAVAYVRAWL